MEISEACKILGIPVGSDVKTITQAYRRRALEVHPDKNSDKKKDSHDAFIRLAEAYNTLLSEEELEKEAKNVFGELDEACDAIYSNPMKHGLFKEDSVDPFGVTGKETIGRREWLGMRFLGFHDREMIDGQRCYYVVGTNIPVKYNTGLKSGIYTRFGVRKHISPEEVTQSFYSDQSEQRMIFFKKDCAIRYAMAYRTGILSGELHACTQGCVFTVCIPNLNKDDYVQQGTIYCNDYLEETYKKTVGYTQHSEELSLSEIDRARPSSISGMGAWYFKVKEDDIVPIYGELILDDDDKKKFPFSFEKAYFENKQPQMQFGL